MKRDPALYDYLPYNAQRPVIKFLARLAKLGLWVTVFAEPQPQQQYAARHGDNNKSMVCHSEGW